jgi:hypothetical protein
MSGCLIVNQCPTYRLITNNCQNFSKLLVDRIRDSSQDAGTERIETIQDVFERVVWEWIRDRNSGLPGSYPLEISDEDEGYVTAEDNEDSAGEEWSESGIFAPLVPASLTQIIMAPATDTGLFAAPEKQENGVPIGQPWVYATLTTRAGDSDRFGGNNGCCVPRRTGGAKSFDRNRFIFYIES